MALFALGATQVFAQPELTPTPLTCIELDDPLNVVAGQSYTYTVDVPAPPGDKTYHWFVTTDINFLTGGGLTTEREIFGGDYLASGSAHYNAPTAGEAFNTINLTWQSFTLDTTADEYLFVVIYVENAGTDGCITDNLKVYRVQTVHAFTLDIANIDLDDPNNPLVDEDDLTEVCVDDVFSAVFDPTGGTNNEGGVVYDFGQNRFYYVVAAANFSGAYQLSAQLTGLQGGSGLAPNDGQTATLYWSDTYADVIAEDLSPLSGSSAAFAHDDTETPPPLGVINGPADGNAVGPDGQMLYLVLVIDHNSFEATDAIGYEYTLAIDGVLVDDATPPAPLGPIEDFGDMVDNYTEDVCDGVIYEAFAKASIQTLLPRPTIDSTPGADFEPIVD